VSQSLYVEIGLESLGTWGSLGSLGKCAVRLFFFAFLLTTRFSWVGCSWTHYDSHYTLDSIGLIGLGWDDGHPLLRLAHHLDQRRRPLAR